MMHPPRSLRRRLIRLVVALMLTPCALADANSNANTAAGPTTTTNGSEMGAPDTSNEAPRLATLDWTLAETLVALDAAPTAVAQIDTYRAWVGEPALPPSVEDLGLRAQPNLERLARLAPDRILISPLFANLTPRLERIAPVSRFSFHSPQEPIWPQLLAMTRRLAALSGKEAQGEALIASTENRLARLRETLAHRPTIAQEPLLIVQLMDARHVRVFGDHGLYQAVLERLGLTNAWRGETNVWGYSVVGLEALAAIEARLVVVEPLPEGVSPALDDSGLWQSLPSVREKRVITLPPVWSAGALPSARRFAETLTQGLLQDENLDHAH